MVQSSLAIDEDIVGLFDPEPAIVSAASFPLPCRAHVLTALPPSCQVFPLAVVVSYAKSFEKPEYWLVLNRSGIQQQRSESALV